MIVMTEPECGTCTGPDPLDVLEQWVTEKKKSYGDHPWWQDRRNLCDEMLERIAELRQHKR